MLEGFVGDLLRKYLNDYVDFKQENIDIAISSGEATLTNMRLKPGSLDGLNLPIEVQFGYIGELRLTIPFSNLSKEPCVAEIDRIFMVARTKPDLADTADGIQFNNLPPAIMASLLADKLEKLLKHELEMFGNKDGKQQEQDMTFAQRFAEKIIDNLQVHIGRVHIRYEYTPDMSNLQRSVPAFALGIIIDELSAFTTDANFQNVVFVVNQPQILKKIDLRQFAVYLQSDECVASQNPDFFDDVFETNPKMKYQYLLQPQNGHINITIQKSERASPRFVCDAALEPTRITCTHSQYSNILRLLAHWAEVTQYSKYNRFRINHLASPRSKWQFAFRCIFADLQARRRNFKLESVIKQFANRRRYISLYKRKLNAPGVLPLQDADVDILKSIESSCTYEEIVCFRQLCAAEVRAALGSDTALVRLRETPSFLERLFGSADKQPSIGGKLLSAEDIQRVQDFVEYKPGFSDFELPPWHILWNFRVSMPVCVVELWVQPAGDVAPVKVVECAVEGIAASAIVHPASSIWTARVDNLTAVNCVRNNIVCTCPFRSPPSDDERARMPDMFDDDERRPASSEHTANEANAPPMLRLRFVNHPLQSKWKADTQLYMIAQQLHVIHDQRFVSTLSNFLFPPLDIDLTAALKAISDSLAVYKEFVLETMGKSIWRQRVHDLQISAHLPIFIVPTDATDAHSRALVVDGGAVTISLQQSSAVPLPELVYQAWKPNGWNSQDICSKYHTYRIQVEGAQAYLTSLGRSTRVGRRIVDPIRLDVALRTCAIVNQAAGTAAYRVFEQCPMLLLHGELAPLEVQCSPQLLADMTPLVECLLLPTDDVPVVVDRDAVLRHVRRTRLYAGRDFNSMFSFDLSFLIPSGSRRQIHPLKLMSVAIAAPRLCVRFSHNSSALTVSALSAMSSLESKMTALLDATAGLAAAAAAAEELDEAAVPSNDQSAESTAFEFVISGLRAQSMVRPFDARSRLHVSGLWLEDVWMPMPAPFNRMLQAGGTAAGDEFMQLEWDTTNPLSPHLVRGAHGERIDARLHVHTGHVNVQVNPESLLNAGTFLVADLLPYIERWKNAHSISNKLFGTVPVIEVDSAVLFFQAPQVQNVTKQRKLIPVLIDPSRGITGVKARLSAAELARRSSEASADAAALAALAAESDGKGLARGSSVQLLIQASFDSLRFHCNAGSRALVSLIMTECSIEQRRFKLSSTIRLNIRSLDLVHHTPSVFAPDNFANMHAVSVLSCAHHALSLVPSKLERRVENDDTPGSGQLLSLTFRTFDPNEADAPLYLSQLECLVQGPRLTLLARFFHDLYTYFTDGPLGCLSAILVQHVIRTTNPSRPLLHRRLGVAKVLSISQRILLDTHAVEDQQWADHRRKRIEESIARFKSKSAAASTVVSSFRPLRRVAVEIRDFELRVPKFVLARDQIIVSCASIAVHNTLVSTSPVHERYMATVAPVNVDFSFAGFQSLDPRSSDRSYSIVSAQVGGVDDSMNMDHATRGIRAIYDASTAASASRSLNSTQLRLIALPAFDCSLDRTLIPLRDTFELQLADDVCVNLTQRQLEFLFEIGRSNFEDRSRLLPFMFESGQWRHLGLDLNQLSALINNLTSGPAAPVVVTDVVPLPAIEILLVLRSFRFDMLRGDGVLRNRDLLAKICVDGLVTRFHMDGAAAAAAWRCFEFSMQVRRFELADASAETNAQPAAWRQVISVGGQEKGTAPILLTISQREQSLISSTFTVARPRVVLGGLWLALHTFFIGQKASHHKRGSHAYRAVSALISQAESALREREADDEVLSALQAEAEWLDNSTDNLNLNSANVPIDDVPVSKPLVGAWFEKFPNMQFNVSISDPAIYLLDRPLSVNSKALALVGELTINCEFKPKELLFSSNLKLNQVRLGYVELNGFDESNVLRTWTSEPNILQPFQLSTHLFLSPSPLVENERKLKLELHMTLLETRVSYCDYHFVLEACHRMIIPEVSELAVVDTLKWDQLHAAAAAVGIELPRQPPRDSELDQDWNVRAPAFLKALKVPSSRKNSVVRSKSIRGANVAGAQLFGVRQDSIQPPQLQPQYLDQVPEDDVVESSLSQQDGQILDVSDDLPVVHANRISQAETDSRVHMLLLRAQNARFQSAGGANLSLVLASTKTEQSETSLLSLFSFSDKSFDFEIDGCTLVLINDAGQVSLPLLHASVSHSRFSAFSFGSRISFSSRSAAALRYFNLRSAKWESVMDEVVANCNFQHDYDTQLLEFTVNLSPLRLSASFALAHSLVNSWTLLQRAQKNSIETNIKTGSKQIADKSNDSDVKVPVESKHMYLPFRIHNETEFPFTFSRPGESEAVSLSPGESRGIKRMEHQPDRFEVVNHVVSISFGSQFEPLPDLSLDIVGVTSLMLKPIANSSKSLPVFADVSLHEGFKILSLRSSIRLFNHTSITVEIGGHILPPQTPLHVPLAQAILLMSSGSLSVRPLVRTSNNVPLDPWAANSLPPSRAIGSRPRAPTLPSRSLGLVQHKRTSAATTAAMQALRSRPAIQLPSRDNVSDASASNDEQIHFDTSYFESSVDVDVPSALQQWHSTSVFSQVLRCSPAAAHSDLHPLFLLLSLRSSESESSLASASFELHDTIKLENMLPCPLHLHLSSILAVMPTKKQPNVEKDIVLPPQSEHWVPWFDVSQPVRCCARLTQNGPSSNSILVNPSIEPDRSLVKASDHDKDDGNEVFNLLTINSSNHGELPLRFSSAASMTRGGVHRLCFFAQYWIYDLTDLNLSLSTTKQALLPAVHIPGAAESGLREAKSPLLLDFGGDKQSLFICNAQAEWSSEVRLDQLAAGENGSNTTVSMSRIRSARAPNRQVFDISLDVSLPRGRLASRTRIVRLQPSIILVNMLRSELQIRQAEADAVTVLKPAPSHVLQDESNGPSALTRFFFPLLARRANSEIPVASSAEIPADADTPDGDTPDGDTPDDVDVSTVGVSEVNSQLNKQVSLISSLNATAFYWSDADKSQQLSLRLSPRTNQNHNGWLWSGRFDLAQGEFCVQTHHGSGTQHQTSLLQVQVMHENGISYVIIGAADTVHPPFRIENRSFTERIRIAQATERAPRWLLVEPYTRIPFALDEPHAASEVLVEIVMTESQRAANPDTEVLSFRLDPGQVKPGPLVYVSLLAPNRQLFFSVELDGPTCVLVVSEFPASSMSLIHRLIGGQSQKQVLEDRLDRLTKRIATFKEEIVMASKEAEKAREQLAVARAFLAGGIDGAVIAIRTTKRLSSGIAQRTSFSSFVSPQTRAQQAQRETGPRGVLQVTIAEARNLPLVGDPSTGSIPNPYVTLTLDSQRARTEVNMQARSPNFGETLSLSVGEQANTLAVNVFSHNLIFADDYLGGSTVSLETLGHAPTDILLRLENSSNASAPSGELVLNVCWIPSESMARELEKAHGSHDEQAVAKRQRHLLAIMVKARLAIALQLREIRVDERQQKLGAMSLHRLTSGSSLPSTVLNTLGRGVSTVTSSVASQLGLVKAEKGPEVLNSGPLAALTDGSKLVHFNVSVTDAADFIISPALLRAVFLSPRPLRLWLVISLGQQRNLMPLFDSGELSNSRQSDSELFIQEAIAAVHRAWIYNSSKNRLSFSCIASAVPTSFLEIHCFAQYVSESADVLPPIVEVGDARVPLSLFPVLAASTVSSKVENLPESTSWCVIQPNSNNDIVCGKLLFAISCFVPTEDRDTQSHISAFLPQFLSSTRVVCEVNMPLLAVAIVDKSESEILYLSLHRSKFTADSVIGSTSLRLQLGHFQIDNMMSHCCFPVLLAPRASTTTNPSVLFSIPVFDAMIRFTDGGMAAASKRNQQQITSSVFGHAPINKVSRPNVVFIDAITVSMREFDLKVEETLIWKLVDVVNTLGLAKYFNENTPSLFISAADQFVRVPPSNLKISLHSLRLSALALNFTFLTDKEMRRQRSDFVVGPLAMILSTVGRFAMIDDAPIRIQEFSIDRSFGSPTVVFDPLVSHFTRQGIVQAWAVLKSLRLSIPARLQQMRDGVPVEVIPSEPKRVKEADI